MDKNEGNRTLQADEVEALSAIYGDEWCVIDVNNRVYCINITDGKDMPPRWSVCLQVHMPIDYPSESPPQYQLNCPWLRGEEKRNLEDTLSEVYCENLGESIIFQWVEKIREFLQEKTDDYPQEPSGSGLERAVTKTTEIDEEDDDFDLLYPELEVASIHPIQSSSSDEDWECPSITSGEPITERRSTFQPHLAPVFHKTQVKMVLDKLYENKKIANATHNIMAYRICQSGTESKSPVVIQGCEDDGETHAGSRMLHLLQILNVQNAVVVVSRWFGGILLGPDRFKHINNCTRSILDQCGYIKNKDEKKGPRTSDKKKR